jgi:hypothetical protein
MNLASGETFTSNRGVGGVNIALLDSDRYWILDAGCQIIEKKKSFLI